MSGHCILVAEDDPLLLYTEVSALKPLGYRVLEARDGEDALNVSQQHAGEIDLLITNVNMPRMLGHELARRIKVYRPNIRVLIVSGQHEDDFPAEAVHHSSALLKPVESKVLLDKVKELLEG